MTPRGVSAVVAASEPRECCRRYAYRHLLRADGNHRPLRATSTRAAELRTNHGTPRWPWINCSLHSDIYFQQPLRTATGALTEQTDSREKSRKHLLEDASAKLQSGVSSGLALAAGWCMNCKQGPRIRSWPGPEGTGTSLCQRSNISIAVHAEAILVTRTSRRDPLLKYCQHQHEQRARRPS